jgi:Transcription factor WhiB
VRADCLRWALDQGSKLPGIWGGTTKHERALLAANRT